MEIKKEETDTEDFQNCVFKSISCCCLSGFVPKEKEAVLLTSIEKDIQTRCKKLKIKQPPGFTEVDLVCNRGGVDRWILHEETSAVCPKHHIHLGGLLI